MGSNPTATASTPKGASRREAPFAVLAVARACREDPHGPLTPPLALAPQAPRRAKAPHAPLVTDPTATASQPAEGRLPQGAPFAVRQGCAGGEGRGRRPDSARRATYVAELGSWSSQEFAELGLVETIGADRFFPTVVAAITAAVEDSPDAPAAT